MSASETSPSSRIRSPRRCPVRFWAESSSSSCSAVILPLRVRMRPSGMARPAPLTSRIPSVQNWMSAFWVPLVRERMPRDWLIETTWRRFASPRIPRSPPKVLMATIQFSPLWACPVQGFFKSPQSFPDGAFGPFQLAARLVDRRMIATPEVVADLGEGPTQQLAGEVEARLAGLGRLAGAAERIDLADGHPEVDRRGPHDVLEAQAEAPLVEELQDRRPGGGEGAGRLGDQPGEARQLVGVARGDVDGDVGQDCVRDARGSHGAEERHAGRRIGPI